MHPWIILFLAIVAEVVATTALKVSDGFTRLLPSVVVVIGYGLAFVLLAMTLKHMTMGIAYAVWAGVGTVLITLVGIFWFRERLDLAGIIGIGLIIAGVLVLNLLSSASAH